MKLSSAFKTLLLSVFAFGVTACNQSPGLLQTSLIPQAFTGEPIGFFQAEPQTLAFPKCVSSDPNHICLGIKMVSYRTPSGNPVLSQSEAIALVNSVNSLWKPCDIAYQIEVFQTVEPSKAGLPYSPDWENDTNKVRRTFQDESRLLITAVGPWTGSTIAVTMMPETGIYGTIVDQQYSHNPLTIGHELGHYQGLYHLKDNNNLMSDFVGPNTKALNASQCETARDVDQSRWAAMLRKTDTE